eukprot:7789967-Pyramimonas_sp.AAC.1
MRRLSRRGRRVGGLTPPSVLSIRLNITATSVVPSPMAWCTSGTTTPCGPHGMFILYSGHQ